MLSTFDLIVKDGFTGDLITDVELRYELGDTEVTILKEYSISV